MREIEFRGKNKCDNKWHYGYLVYVPADNSYKITQGNVLSYFVETDSIGQYIGLNDNTEHKVYEGDILTDPSTEDLYVVEFIDGEFILRLDNNAIIRIENVHFMTVIGNIYDNPELLGGTDEDNA